MTCLPPCVIRLSLACRPAAIPRRVRTVIVDAIKRIFRRAWSHVAQKLASIVYPFIAHPDPSAAIVFEAWIVWIRAALLSGAPSIIFSRLSASMNQMAADSEAPASESIAPSQHFGLDSFCLPAVAFAQPRRPAILIRTTSNNKQSPEALARKVHQRYPHSNIVCNQARLF
jgi:hypothetical protein